MTSNYGLLLNKQDILLQRSYFNELVTMIGVNVMHRAPRPDKHYTTYAEIQGNYFEPEQVGCIFVEHVDQKTMKKLGWNAELNTSAALISVPSAPMQPEPFNFSTRYIESSFSIFLSMSRYVFLHSCLFCLKDLKHFNISSPPNDLR